MAWTEFYMDISAGSNLNSGSTTGAAAHTYTSGTLATVSTTMTYTPATANPVSDGVAVGDWISIYADASTTTPFISKVTTVTSTTIVCDSTANKFGTAPADGVATRSVKHGGAWLDLGMTAIGVALSTGTIPISMRINVKAGTYSNTTTSRTLGLAGAATTPLWWRGYKTSIGDQDTNNVAVAGTDIPSITFTTGQFIISGTHQILSNIDIQSQCVTANGAVVLTSGATHSRLYRFRVNNTAANSAARALSLNGADQSIIACYLKATTTASTCIIVVSNGTILLGSTITGGISGVFLNTAAITQMYALFCIFDSQAGDAFSFSSASSGVIANCSFYNPTGNGITIPTTIAGPYYIMNNYFENVNQAAKAAINNTSGGNTDVIIAIGNAYFNCTSNTSGITETFLIFDNGTLASAAFTTPGSQDFSVGTIAKALAFPGLFENVSAYQGYLDIGAVQRIEGSGTIMNVME